MYYYNSTKQAQKRAENNFINYMNSKDDSIFKSYSRPSQAKIEVYIECRKLAYENGFNFVKVISHNSYIFTAGCIKLDKENGNIIEFMYITPNYYTIVKVD